MKGRWLPVIICLLLSCRSSAQEYGYTHYGVVDGLAGSILYCITQDKDGFLWTGTDAGVSRFDGTQFRNFTTRDGLPDLEVLQIFGDRKGRVWMAPFHKSVCYYYQGMIHNDQNDPILAAIHLKQNVESFAEDNQGNILIQERTALHLVRTDGSTVEYDSLDHRRVTGCYGVGTSAGGNFLAQTDSGIFEFSSRRLIRAMDYPFSCVHTNHIAFGHDIVVLWRNGSRFDIRSLSTGRVIGRTMDSLHYKHIGFSIIGDSLAYHNELSGSTEHNIHTGQTRQYLPGISVSRVFRDAAGNLWFTTMGEGLFRLQSNTIRSVTLTVNGNERSSVTAISKIGNQLWVGDNHSYLFRLSFPHLRPRPGAPFPYYISCRILYLDTVKDLILVGSDYGLTRGTRDGRLLRQIKGTIKSAIRINDRELLEACNWGAGIVDLRELKVTDTLLRERSTVVFHQGDTLFIGTLNGLYRSVKGRPMAFLGNETPFLKRRISSIVGARDGTLWIASYDDAGIIGYRNGRQVASITQAQGLTSDICRTLLINNDILWAGTDKGLNRIELDKPGHPVTQFTSRDGLPADMINTLFADGSEIYIGTPAGLSVFNEKEILGGEECLLYLLSIKNSNRERIADSAVLQVPDNDRRVGFEFAGISYRSAGDIVYRYRMLGLDSSWQETRQHSLLYPDLPGGEYQFQLMAVNKFSSQSRILTIPIRVEVPFWKRSSVIITAWLLSLLSLWLIVAVRIRRVRRRQAEKQRLMKKVGELENTALKSQMNPHFIFNCLTSILRYVSTGDTSRANEYIAGLGKLIRMTLNNSSKSFISIEEEIEYLSSYLSLEKMRFKGKIDFQLLTDPSIATAGTFIPPMLVQPHVENALHHGLPDKTDGSGTILVSFVKEDRALVVTVTDNGVGRANSAEKKRVGPVTPDSRGLALTQDRILVLNKLYKSNITLTINDLKGPAGEAAGTRIILYLPLFLGDDPNIG